MTSSGLCYKTIRAASHHEVESDRGCQEKLMRIPAIVLNPQRARVRAQRPFIKIVN